MKPVPVKETLLDGVEPLTNSQRVDGILEALKRHERKQIEELVERAIHDQAFARVMRDKFAALTKRGQNPLPDWKQVAARSIADNLNGTPASEVVRVIEATLGVSERTAWRLFNRAH